MIDKSKIKFKSILIVQLTFWALINDVWVILFGEDVELKNARVDKVMANEEAILLSFEPALPAREPDGTRLLADFVVDMVDITHVPLQLD